MAGITYSGTAVAQELGGSLFSGRRAWLSHHVPMRKHFTDLITSNGGSVVPLEKDADLWIADHLKPRDIPPGSLSYEYIDACVQKGQLVDQQPHRCNRPERQVREVGSTQPIKKSRTPFTKSDDAILWQWVRDAQAQGRSITGNVLYQALEKEHPQHTFQSWRERWLRYLSEAGPPQVAQLTVQANCGTEVPTTSAPRENPSMLSVGSPPSGQSKRSRDLSPPVAGRLDAENPPRPAPPALRQNTPGASRSIPLRSSLPWSQQTALLISRQSPALGSRVSSGGTGAIIFTQDDQNFLLARGVKILSMQRRQANMQDYWTGLADGRGKGTPQQWSDLFATMIAKYQNQKSASNHVNQPSPLAGRQHTPSAGPGQVKMEQVGTQQPPLGRAVNPTLNSTPSRPRAHGRASAISSSPVAFASPSGRVASAPQHTAQPPAGAIEDDPHTGSLHEQAKRTNDVSSSSTTMKQPNPAAQPAPYSAPLTRSAVTSRSTRPALQPSAVPNVSEEHVTDKSAEGTDDEGMSEDEAGAKVIIDWTNEMLGFGFSTERATRALLMTTKDLILAETVLRSWQKFGVPEAKLGNGPYVRGVWTTMDDEALRKEEPLLMKELRSKHGRENVLERSEFLQDFEEE